MEIASCKVCVGLPGLGWMSLCSVMLAEPGFFLSFCSTTSWLPLVVETWPPTAPETCCTPGMHQER